MRPIVYLAGGINGLPDSECRDWRDEAKKRLQFTRDPMRRDYRGKEAENAAEIVRGDLVDINESDVVLAMCPRPSWGTAMEIFYSWLHRKPVIAVVPRIKDTSPWLRHHATSLHESLEDALNAIDPIGTPRPVWTCSECRHGNHQECKQFLAGDRCSCCGRNKP